jgi:hypothetical protein
MPTFFWGVIVTVVAKLWLTSQIRIAPVFADHDAENYVEHARDLLAGAWFGGYSDLTLIKEPFYPIYLALVQETGLTLPLANLLMYAVACIVACLAIRPVVRNGAVLAVMFAVLFFDPLTYSWEAWMGSRSEVNGSLALLATACALAILVRRRSSLRRLAGWWIGLGVAFAAFWLTREEALWLVPGIVVIVAAYALSIRQDPHRRPKLAGIAIPLAIVMLSSAAIAEMNERVYGWRTDVEVKAPEFVSAYTSLARIVPEKTEPLIVVPRSSRAIAYRVSPAARELQPALEGPLGRTWTDVVCKSSAHVCTDIAGSFFVWALRDAVAAAGHYTSGRDARDYYVRLAAEIDRACDTAAIACRPKAPTIFPNPELSQLPEILANVRDGIVMVTTFSPFSLAHVTVPADPVLDAKYAYIVRSLTVDRTGYKGWIATDRPMRLTLEYAAGTIPIDGAMRLASDDIAADLARSGHRGWDDRTARFSFMSDCVDGCFIVATDSQNHQTRIPLTATVRSVVTPHVVYRLDLIQNRLLTYDDGAKQAILAITGRIYAVAVPLALAVTALLLLLRLGRAIVKRRARPGPFAVLAAAVAISGLALISILAVLTVSFSAGFSAEYVGSFVPLLLFALCAVAAHEYTVIYRAGRLSADRRRSRR